MTYLDNASTTSLMPEVAKRMFEVLSETYGNPSSIHGYGRAASKLLREARQDIATCLGTQPQHLIFTSGGTEANNLALKGYALANQDKGRHIITTAIEHHSILHTAEYLRDRLGFDVTFITPKTDGTISTEQVEAALRPDTILVSTMYANNETGMLLPIQAIGDLLANHQAAFHVDAVQAIGKLAINPETLGIDMLSASAHKFHGPKGVGFLYAKNIKLDNLLHGGEQEDNHRASTENLASIVGMALALQRSLEQAPSKYRTIQNLKDYLLQGLEGVDYYLNQFGDTLPHILNIAFPGLNQDLLLMKLDLADVAVSTGSACTAGDIEPSHVLASVYGDHSPKLKENIRISFSDTTTIADIDHFLITLKGILPHGI